MSVKGPLVDDATAAKLIPITLQWKIIIDSSADPVVALAPDTPDWQVTKTRLKRVDNAIRQMYTALDGKMLQSETELKTLGIAQVTRMHEIEKELWACDYTKPYMIDEVDKRIAEISAMYVAMSLAVVEYEGY